MTLKIIALASALAVLAGGLLTQSSLNPALSKDVQALAAAKTLRVTLNFSEVPGSPAECTIEYARPNKFRIETPDKLTVSDGTTVWDYDKNAKTYTENKADLKRTTDRDVAAWSPFFDKEPFKDITKVALGQKRQIKGVDVQDCVVTMPDSSTETLFLDASTGVARGALIDKKQKKTLATASKLAIDGDPIADTEFTFNPPADAKKVDNTPPAASFASVEGIFKTSCTGCHSATRPSGGLDLSSYDAVMAGGQSGKCIVAGDPDNSLLLQLVNGTKKPSMPKGSDPLDSATVQTISDWIKAGAKNN
jgi:outer membrane lipoprotein-sorting protein